MLTYDPIPWLMAQEGLSAVRARRLLNLGKREDEEVVAALRLQLPWEQQADGSLELSTMKTAGVLNLLDDLKAAGCEELIAAAEEYRPANASWREFYNQLGHEAPKDGGRTRARRLVGARAVRVALQYEKEAIGELKKALAVAG